MDFFAFFVAFEAKIDQFEVATVTTVEEARKVLSVGFEYVTEKTGIMLFRRPKRFSAYVS